ncbi:MAG: hypothetical protein ABJC05_03765, partial [Pyrinomonadaceae bacterium]
VEFAIKDGVPYAIDFMNPAPDAELQSVGEFYHGWVTDAVTDLVFKRLAESRERPRYRWDAFLNPEPNALAAVASAGDQAARTIIPQPVREIPREVAGAVGDLIAGAADSIAQTAGSVIRVEVETSQDAEKESGARTKTRSGATKRSKRKS